MDACGLFLIWTFGPWASTCTAARSHSSIFRQRGPGITYSSGTAAAACSCTDICPSQWKERHMSAFEYRWTGYRMCNRPQFLLSGTLEATLLSGAADDAFNKSPRQQSIDSHGSVGSVVI
ncbi:hypothetical protein Vretifemale_2813 [Volvox reticuliferus]|uniref:Secreted protein n=1 Tax=Volvox reticuliferus TaxID=1737510 RepID=A0A8J4C1R4_9CHLO|nr:hypothetical protein Vretifemale_2813 [Volvox reticuliferus]